MMISSETSSLLTEFCRCVVGPQSISRAGIEAVHDSGSALGKYAVAMNGWRRSWTDIAQACLNAGRVKPRLVGVRPNWLTCLQPVAGNNFILAALLLLTA